MNSLRFPFFCILSLLLGHSHYTQTIARISCLDRSNLQAIPNAILRISFDDSTLVQKSNATGNVLFLSDINLSNLIISVEHPMYEPLTFKQNILSSTKDTLSIKLSLKPIKNQSLNQVVVKSPGVPDTVFNSLDFHVEDFEITSEGNYLLLVYPKRSRHQNMLLLFDGSRVRDSLSVPAAGINLIKDYRDSIHLICQEEVFHITTLNESIEISSIPKNYFFDYILPIVDSTTARYFISNFNEFYPAFDYFSFDALDSSYRKVLHIEDSFMMELYRSEIKWVDVRTRLWAKQKEIETGIDAPIWVGANYFTQSIYYKAPYAPLFNVNDSIYVFDFQSDQLLVYNKQGDFVDTRSLLFHYRKDKTGWKRVMLKDEKRQLLYTLFEKDGISYLGRVDLNTGLIISKHRIYHKYVEKIRIHNGFAYYVYRPFESIQKRFLYKERLFD